jgi:hypothetical protein
MKNDLAGRKHHLSSFDAESLLGKKEENENNRRVW